MTLITLPYSPVDGDPEDISEIMANFNAILAVVNGGLQNDNVAADAAIAHSKLALTPEAFIAPTLLHSWANMGAGYNVAGYYKDPFGIVHLRGVVNSGVDEHIFTLPAGYRPVEKEWHRMDHDVSIGDYGVTIDTNGEVSYHIVIGALTAAYLDGITFIAA
jgi:hypothetical protein